MLFLSFAPPETWRNPGQTEENDGMYNGWLAYHNRIVKLSQNKKFCYRKKFGKIALVSKDISYFINHKELK